MSHDTLAKIAVIKEAAEAERQVARQHGVGEVRGIAEDGIRLHHARL